MHKDRIVIPNLDAIREALETFRESEDESVRKEAEALSRDFRDADGNLEGVSATLHMGVRPILPKLTSRRAGFIRELLKEVPEATGTRQSMVDSFCEFARKFNQYHRGETFETEGQELSLVEIRNEIDDCVELCRIYGDLFAQIRQEMGPQDEYTKRLEINESVLSEIIRRETAVDPQMPAQPITEVEGPEIPPLPPEDDPMPSEASEVAAEAPHDVSQENSNVGQTPVVEEVPPPTSTASRAENTDAAPIADAVPIADVVPVLTENNAPVDGKCADVVFVIDASGSMRTCFDQLRTHIRRFVEPFREEGFSSLRMGLLAYSANINRTTKKCIYRNIVIGGEGASAMKSLYGSTPIREDLFFTKSQGGAVDTESFMHRLDGIRCKGDEDTVFALDCAADFPYGPLASTRRVMVLFTDEKIEDGVLKQESIGENFSQVEKVMKKIADRHISLYVFAPASPVTDMMSEFSRVFLTVVPEFRPEATDTWTNIDFARILDIMGKTVSSSLSGGKEKDFSRAIFGQDAWEDDRWA